VKAGVLRPIAIHLIISNSATAVQITEDDSGITQMIRDRIIIPPVFAGRSGTNDGLKFTASIDGKIAVQLDIIIGDKLNVATGSDESGRYFL
jgi:hypothetical protein